MRNRIIYADNAATTKLDADAFEAMKPFLLENYANPSQPYSFSRPVKEAIKSARQTVAGCINAGPEEIFFTSGGTESDNWAIKGTALLYNDFRATLTTQIEHHAVFRACEAVETLGFPVAYMFVNKQISHVLKAIDLDESYAKGTIRISFGRDNTEEDAADIAEALIRILKK